MTMLPMSEQTYTMSESYGRSHSWKEAEDGPSFEPGLSFLQSWLQDAILPL